MRLFHRAIHYAEAIAIAVVGLAVNLPAPGWRAGHGHDHDHGHHHHHDHNLRAAYLHVLADALTSVLAIVGLLPAGSTAGPGWIR